MLGEILYQVHMSCHSRLHVEGASSEHVLSGFYVCKHLVGKLEGLFQLFGKLLALERVFPYGSEIVHSYGVQVPYQNDGSSRITFRTFYISIC